MPRLRMTSGDSRIRRGSHAPTTSTDIPWKVRNMAEIWLIEGRPDRVLVEEHHTIKFTFGDNPQPSLETSILKIAVRLPLDGHRHLPTASAELALQAQEVGGIARLGVFGFTRVRPTAENGSENVRSADVVPFPLAALSQALGSYLHRNPNDQWMSWALDLPENIDLDALTTTAIAREQVWMYEWELSLQPEIYPISLAAELQILGDNLARRLSEVAQDSADEVEHAGDKASRAQALAEAMQHSGSDRSLFILSLSLSLPVRDGEVGIPGAQARLRRLALDWPPGSDGSDARLYVQRGVRETEIRGSYDASDKQVKFWHWQGIEFAPEEHLALHIRIDNPIILADMHKIHGSLGIEMGWLACGLCSFFANAQGQIIAGLRQDNDEITAETTIVEVDFEVDLHALFRRRLAVHQIRMQFPRTGLGEDQLRQARQLFRNHAFTSIEPVELPEQTPTREQTKRALIWGQRIVEGAPQSLAMLLAFTEREITLEEEDQSGRRTEKRQSGDTTIDIAAVGRDYRKLVKLLGDLQQQITSVLLG